jgi:hypothetical protein
MAEFRGNIKEFHDFIGPRIRNKVNYETRKIRKSHNKKCQECKEENHTLDAAHIHGKERPTIIEAVLKKHIKGGVIVCNLQKVEAEIIAAHHPLKECFRFLCKRCHREYDRKSPRSSANKKSRVRPRNYDSSRAIGKVERISRHPRQINHRMIRAYLLLEKEQARSREDFFRICVKKCGILPEKVKSHYPSMKTETGKNHGNFFYEEKNGNVHMHEAVRKEVRKYQKNFE